MEKEELIKVGNKIKLKDFGEVLILKIEDDIISIKIENLEARFMKESIMEILEE